MMGARSTLVAALVASFSYATLAGPAHAGGQAPDPRLHGTVALNGCSGALFRFEGQSLDSTALVLTNGHCLTTMGAYQVFVDRDIDREVIFYDSTGAQTSPYRATKVVYATMHQTDMAVLAVGGVTYQDLLDVGVTAFVLDSERAQVGEPLMIPSGFWEYVTTCTLDGFVHQMLEGLWTWSDSLRFTAECVTFGGTSGSPVVSTTSGKIIGVNNTGYEGGEACTRDNPCEVDVNGEITTVPDGSYGQQTYHLYGCVDANFAIDLERSGCELPRPSGVLELVGIQVSADTECDDDGNLDAGETGIVTVTLGNDGPIGLDSATMTISSSSPHVTFVGETTVSVGAIGPFEQKSVDVEIALGLGVFTIDSIGFDIVADDPGSAAPPAQLTGLARVNFDDVAEATTRDTVESTDTAWTTEDVTELMSPAGWTRRADETLDTSWYGRDIPAQGNQYLISPTLEVSEQTFRVTFHHRYSFETSRDTFWDGAVIEVSTDDGMTWRDATELAGDIGYGGMITDESGNPLAGRQAFVDQSPDWPDTTETTLTFGTRLANESVLLRFRIGTDAAAGDFGWEIDDISVVGITNTPFGRITDDQDLCGVEPPGEPPTTDSPLDTSHCSTGQAPGGSLALLALAFVVVARRRRR